MMFGPLGNRGPSIYNQPNYPLILPLKGRGTHVSFLLVPIIEKKNFFYK
jgi:hypothetical protein